MDAFSYLSVLLSIIIGLGLTQVLTSCGRLIRHRDRVRVYWPPLLWAGIVLLISVQMWWSMFGLRLYQNWTFLTFFVVLLQTVTLYMMAAVVLPEQIDETLLDLRSFYLRQRGWLLVFLLATIIVSIIKELLLVGRPPLGLNLAFHLLLAAACISGLFIRRQRYHELLAVGCAVGLVAYVTILFARLQ
jgi:hypothetical protein